ncbi:MAG: arsenate-mycothiol transferase ArsC [Thermoplasmatota archaeon]
MAHKVLFVDLGNSCRSQMAEGFARRFGLKAESAGTMAAREVSQAAILVMQERAVDISGHRPKQLDFRSLGDFERVVSMGPDVRMSSPDLQATEEWSIQDPVNRPVAIYRDVRDQIERRVRAMADEIQQWSVQT